MAAAAFAIAVAASAANATHYCEDSQHLNLAGQAYVAFPECLSMYECNHARAYVEWNMQPGLQRGGTALLGDVDECQTYANPDLGVY